MTTTRRVRKEVTMYTEKAGPHLGDIAPRTMPVVAWIADEAGDYIEISREDRSKGYHHILDTDPTNSARQARYRKARALGYEHVSGYLPPKRAAKVRQWLAEAAASGSDDGDAAAKRQAARKE